MFTNILNMKLKNSISETVLKIFQKPPIILMVVSSFLYSTETYIMGTPVDYWEDEARYSMILNS